MVLSNGASVDGNVRAGGNVMVAEGTGIIDGNVVASGRITGVEAASYTEGAPFAMDINLAEAAQFYRDQSANLAALPTNVGYSVNDGGLIHLVLPGAGRHAASIPSAVLRDAWGINIYGPSDAEIIINVPDENVEIGHLCLTHST